MVTSLRDKKDNNRSALESVGQAPHLPVLVNKLHVNHWIGLSLTSTQSLGLLNRHRSVVATDHDSLHARLAGPGNWTSIRTAFASRDLALGLLVKLDSLPVPVDRRMEFLRVDDSPDLFADGEILGIDSKRLTPDCDRLLLAAKFMKCSSELQFRLDSITITSVEYVGLVNVGTGTRIASREEALDDFVNFRFRDIKSAVVCVPDDSFFVDQKSVRHDFESETSAEHAGVVNEHTEGHPGGLNERAGGLGPLLIEGDSNDLDRIRTMKLSELLPPGQLCAASSPGAPEEENPPDSPQSAELDRLTIQRRKRHIRQ